jgi:hypothetical protein
MVNWLLNEGDIRHSRFVTHHATEDSPDTADEDTPCGRGNLFLIVSALRAQRFWPERTAQQAKRSNS